MKTMVSCICILIFAMFLLTFVITKDSHLPEKPPRQMLMNDFYGRPKSAPTLDDSKIEEEPPKRPKPPKTPPRPPGHLGTSGDKFRPPALVIEPPPVTIPPYNNTSSSGGGEGGGSGRRETTQKAKEKASGIEGNVEESAPNKENEARHTSSSSIGRGRGCGRGKGRGQGKVSADREPLSTEPESDPSTSSILQNPNPSDNHPESVKTEIVESVTPSTAGLEFDLNATGSDENPDKTSAAPPPPPPEASEDANSEHPRWSFSEFVRRIIDFHLALAISKLDEEDERL